MSATCRRSASKGMPVTRCLLPSARNDHERTRIVHEARDVLNALERAGAVTAEEWRALGRDWLGRWPLPECRHNFRERDAKELITAFFFARWPASPQCSDGLPGEPLLTSILVRRSKVGRQQRFGANTGATFSRAPGCSQHFTTRRSRSELRTHTPRRVWSG